MRRIILLLVLALSVVLALPVAAHAAPVFVSAFGSDVTGDGGPGNPFATVQPAIDAASSGDDVYVGMGTFVGDATMKNGVSLYGAGASQTTLQGTGTTSVVTAHGIGGGETISGFTITGGDASYGGGIDCLAASPTISSNTITGNSAPRGGAISCDSGSSPTITNNTITDNAASYGGGAIFCNAASSPTIEGNTITNNDSANLGGAIYCASSSPTIEDNTITGNSVVWGGGAIYLIGSSPTITDNTITDNASGEAGGAICCDLDSAPTIEDNTIIGNSATFNGGAVYCDSSSPRIGDNAITANVATFGGGVYSEDSSPTIESNSITGNFASDTGGGIFSMTSSATIMGNAIVGNTATWQGGGMYSAFSPDTIVGNTIAANGANYGGGIYCGDSSPQIVNNIITGNTATTAGGAIYCDTSFPTITNNTIAANTSPGGGGISCDGFSSPAITNCILWGNTGDLGGCVATYSDIEDGDAGLGNISADPSFVDTATGNFRLPASSPCIDVATATVAPAMDRDGIFRPQGAGFDMGAYEYFAPAGAAPIDPTLTSATHAQGVWSDITNVTVDMSGATSTVAPIDGFAISVSMNATEYPLPIITDDAATTAFDFVAMPDGVYYVNVATVDEVGNWSVGTHYGPILIDTVDPIDPVLGSTTHTPDTWSNETSITLTLSGADGTGSSVDGYSIEWSQDAILTPTQSVTHPAGTTEVEWGAPSDGEWYANVSTVDEAGNWTSTAHLGPFLIDTVDPTADDNAPGGWVNYDYPFEINAEDAGGSDVASIDVTVTPVLGSVSFQPTPGDHFEYLVLPVGITAFEYTAYDMAGNASPSAVATVGVDKFAPETTDDVAALGWQNANVTVSLTASDTPAGIAATYYSTEDSGTMLYTGPFVISDQGETDIMYWSVDNAGNVETPKWTETIYIDKTDPDIFTYRLPATGWASGMALAGAEADDAVSYVHSIWYSINGAPYEREFGDVFTWLETTEGTTTVAMYAMDGAYNTSTTETVTLLVDSTPPVTTDDAPPSWVNTDTVVTLDATDALSGVDETYYTLNGSAVVTYTAPIDVTAEGINTITYWSVDDAGNVENAKMTQVKIDQTGPVVTDDSTSAWQQGPVTVTFTEADAGADASMFYYSLDGSAEATTAASMVATGTGVHELEYYGVDSVGNPGPLGHATIRIDDDDPMSSSDIDSAWQHGPVDVTITATDAHSGVASIETTITDPPPGSVTATSVPSDMATFTVSIEGTTVVEYHAIDMVGNEETATVEIVRVDNTAPVVSIAPVATAAIDTITFAITATDPLSGVAKIYYSVDGGPVVEGTSVTVDKVGDHTITYWAVDIAGNECVHATHDVRVSPSKTTYIGVAGANRYATAVAASKRTFPSGAAAVIVATGDNWPDALGGAALAGVYDAPVLLTRKDALPDNVAAEIRRLDPMHVFVLGGTSVVSEDIEAQIRALVVPTANLERFWGANRYITTEIIAARVTRESLAFDGTAFVATGMDFPDALAAAPLATALERPLYLAGPSGLSAGTLKAMKNAGVTDVVILGGTSAVPSAVETQLNGASIAYERLAGVNRYATAIDVATSGVAAGLSWDKVALASGIDFPDALSGGVMQGHDSSVMLLTPSDSLNGGVKVTLKANRDIIGEVRYIGGTAAVGQSVRDAVKQVLR